MHNTSTEYKQMHNKTISCNVNWILIFICFMGRIFLEPSASSSSSFMISYPNDKMDKRFIKNWVLHIPHHLRDLLLNGERLIFNLLPSFFFSSYETSFFFFPESTESNHFLLAPIPHMIMGGHSLLLLLLLQDVMHSGSSHSSAVFSNPSSKLCSYIQIA